MKASRSYMGSHGPGSQARHHERQSGGIRSSTYCTPSLWSAPAVEVFSARTDPSPRRPTLDATPAAVTATRVNRPIDFHILVLVFMVILRSDGPRSQAPRLRPKLPASDTPYAPTHAFLTRSARRRAQPPASRRRAATSM